MRREVTSPTLASAEGARHLLLARVIGTSAQADRSYARVSYRGNVVIMLGHERRGLSAAQRRICHRVVTIPTACDGSLNVASAAAILLFEAVRQRRLE
ncbi:MAG: TrmH family RNA methyltransferase [Planctomycetota bacterium]|jgi:TrmH family RNA methyltransferase